jgi:hypothetical protein
MLGSRIKILGDAIVAVLNADADLTARAFALRKKPYNRGRSWQAGGHVTPIQTQRSVHENAIDERVYRFLVVVSDPADADLVTGLESHLGAIERVENIFENKSHGFMPNSLRTTAQTALDTASSAGKFGITKIQGTDIEFASPFVEGAFEGGYDASSVVVLVRCTVARYDARSL